MKVRAAGVTDRNERADARSVVSKHRALSARWHGRFKRRSTPVKRFLWAR